MSKGEPICATQERARTVETTIESLGLIYFPGSENGVPIPFENPPSCEGTYKEQALGYADAYPSAIKVRGPEGETLWAKRTPDKDVDLPERPIDVLSDAAERRATYLECLRDHPFGGWDTLDAMDKEIAGIKAALAAVEGEP